MKHHQRLYIRLTGRLLFITWILLISISPYSKAQTLAELETELAMLQAELDSTSLLGFIDSLIQIAEPKSAISLGTGYSNQVFTNGQDLGIKQFGVNSNLNYYHKSGLYGSYNSFYNSEIDPRFYLNIIGLGYLGIIKSKFNYNVSYEKSFFSEENDNSLTNSLNGTLSYSHKLLFANVTYSYLFENESAHQIIPSLSIQQSFENILFFKRIDLSPTFSFFWASPNAITANFSEEILKELWLSNQLPPQQLEQLLNTPRLSNVVYNRLSSSFLVRRNKSITLLNKSQIGRASCRERCRSRWSPYH